MILIRHYTNYDNILKRNELLYYKLHLNHSYILLKKKKYKYYNYNICYHLWNYISAYDGMVLDFRVEQIPIELNDKYRKKMNKAMMYMYAAVDACQKDNEKYNEALKKSLNLVIKKNKVKMIKRVMDNNETEDSATSSIKKKQRMTYQEKKEWAGLEEKIKNLGAI